jgi:nicotinamidase-related amidase
MEQVLWPAHCIQETDDAALHKDLIVNSSKNNVIHIRKGLDPDVDSYSAFWDNNKHTKTELDDVLKQWNVTHVYVAGLATDYCVAATASDAIDLNYTTYLIEDACRGVANETIKNKTEEMKQRGINIIHSREVNTLVNIASYNQISFLFMIFLLFSAIIFK